MIRPFVWFFILISIVGCSTPTRFYVLSTASPPAEPLEDSQTAIIALEAINIPSYIDQTRMVRRTGANTMTIHEHHQWREPLDAGIQRVLAINLTLLLPNTSIHPVPLPRGIVHDHRLFVKITRFDAVEDGSIFLSGNAWLDIGKNRETIKGHAFDLHVASHGTDSADIAAAMSEALAQLSQEIVLILQ